MLNNPEKTLNTALRMARSGDLTAGFRIIEELVDNNPFFIEARAHRAWWYYCSERYEDAVADLRIVLQMRPEQAEAHAVLGLCFTRLGRDQEAAAEFVSALRIDPFLRTAIQGLSQLAARKAPVPPEVQMAGLAPVGNPLPFINAEITRLETSRKSGFPASIRPEIGRFLYALTRMIRPGVCVETGTFIGYSSLCIAQALEDNGEGHLHAFDLFLEGVCDMPCFPEPVETGLVVVQEHTRAAGLTHRITFHKGDSAENLLAAVREFGPPDLAFIDGDHTVAGCWRDFAAIQECLKVGAVVVLHDTQPVNSGWEGPYDLLKRLHKEPWGGSYGILNLPTPEGYGVGVIQKTGASVPLGPPMRAASWLESMSRRLMP